MRVGDLFAGNPVCKNFRPKLFDAIRTQVSQFSSVRAADLAEVFEKDVYFEVIGQDFAVVFADVFWGQFHLTSMYVVAVLNEGSVEHDAEHIRRLVVEHDLRIAAHRERHLLVICQRENYRLVFVFRVGF